MLEVSFQVLETLRAIDGEGLRISGAYCGPETYWFFNFRRAMHGVAQRLYGVQLHHNALHAWYPRRIVWNEADYHLANCLFNMDSTLECLVFGLNALGNGKEPSQFLDITQSDSLRRVKPGNVNGRGSLPGYAKYFPSLQQHWGTWSRLIEAVTEYHDVTKHRHAVAGSGQLRRDPPPGFFDGIEQQHHFFVTPFEELILGPEAKLPLGARTKDWRVESYATLEQVMADFKPFIEEALTRTLQDLQRI